MLASADSYVTIAVAITATVFLLGIGAFVGSLAGRRAMLVVPRNESPSGRQIPAEVAQEIEQCRELGGCVSRDADSVAALLSAEAAALPPALRDSLERLITTSKGLSDRLQRIDENPSGKDSAKSRPAASLATNPPPASALPVPPPTATAANQSASKNAAPPGRSESPGLEDARQFPRSPCHGNLNATIYPPPGSPRGEPVQCTLLTRDLSCGGIGIAHSEQLFPRQIIVLDAVGKLLVGEVRWCRQLDKRFYIAGCRLVKTSD